MTDVYDEAGIKQRVPKIWPARLSKYLADLESKLYKVTQVVQRRTELAREALQAHEVRLDNHRDALVSLEDRVAQEEQNLQALNQWRLNNLLPRLSEADTRVQAAEDRTAAVIAAISSAPDFEAAKINLNELDSAG